MLRNKKISIVEYKPLPPEKILEIEKRLKEIRQKKLSKKPRMRTFKEFLMREADRRVLEILDKHLILSSIRMDYINFARSCIHDIFRHALLHTYVDKKSVIDMIISHKKDLWFKKFKLDKGVIKDIINEIYNICKDMDKLKWEFVDFCEKQGVEIERIKESDKT